MADDPILTLENVVAGYGRMTILNGLSATIRRGAITTVIGPNGAGKSTLFKTVFGLLRRALGQSDVRRRGHHRLPAAPHARRAACATCRKAAISSPSCR